MSEPRATLLGATKIAGPSCVTERPVARLTMSPDMPDHLLLTAPGRLDRIKVRVTRGGLVQFDTDFVDPPPLELLGANGAVMGSYPVQLVAVARDGTRTYGVKR